MEQLAQDGVPGDVNGVRVTLADYNFSPPGTKKKTKETTLLTIQKDSLNLPLL